MSRGLIALRSRAAGVLALALALAGGTWSLANLHPVRAVERIDGSISFATPPRLVETIANFRAAYTPNAVYYFTLDLPEEAGEPLRKVTVTKLAGGSTIYYNLDLFQAFEGNYRRRGNPLYLAEVSLNRDEETVSMIFDPPVPPGREVTIGLRSIRNPQIPGVYLFEVTAFPAGRAGQSTNGQSLGIGRIHFYRFRGGTTF